MTVAHAYTVAVASGKGGTGKTLVSTNLAALLAGSGSRVVLADCDVEAPNAHLFLPATSIDTSIVTTPIAHVDPDRCTACGMCRDVCAYGAVRVLGSSAIVFDELCHGCGLCTAMCPMGAITEVDQRVGEVETGSVNVPGMLTLVSGRLDVGQVKAPSVIHSVRRRAADIVADYVLLDAPPGVACSAVASTRGVDTLLLVTEPTPFGLHDLELSVRLGRDLGVPMAVIINRVHDDASVTEDACRRWGVPVVARIPFDRGIAEAYADGGLAVDSMPLLREALEPVAGSLQSIARTPSGAIV